MARKKKFTKVWASATDIGREFGLSGIAVHKALAAEGLRDDARAAPSDKAMAEGWARATPLRDGTSHYMWRRDKVRTILEEQHTRLDPREVRFEAFVRQVLALEKEAETFGTDKLLWFFIEEERASIAGTPTAMVEAVCRRTRQAARVHEFLELVTPSADLPPITAPSTPSTGSQSAQSLVDS